MDDSEVHGVQYAAVVEQCNTMLANLAALDRKMRAPEYKGRLEAVADVLKFLHRLHHHEVDGYSRGVIKRVIRQVEDANLEELPFLTPVIISAEETK